MQYATDSAMKRWITVLRKFRKVPNRRLTSSMAAEIKDSISSWDVPQVTNSKARQQVELEVRLKAEPKVQRQCPKNQESSKLDQLTENFDLSQKADELTECWFAMFFSFWQAGDSDTSRTYCSEDRTFTLFDGNSFTRVGVQHQTLLVERDRLAKESRIAEVEM